jgi:hypothetical protein
MVRNLKIAAAVATVLSAGAAYATQPTPTQAASPTVSLYIAGSSAAKNAVLGAIETGICSNSYSLFSSTGNKNFFAVSCTPTQAATGLPSANGTNVFTIWYRDEGGSVTGALPLVTGSSINQLVLSGATGSAGSYTVAVTGESTTNGIDDSFGGGVTKEPVQFGITDVEPGALTGNNYPSAYKSSVYGHATAAQLSGSLTATPIFDQIFGIFVNTNSGGGFSSAENSGHGTATASLSLSYEAISSILAGNSTNWDKVEDVNGNPVTTVSSPITIVNREQGSGSRAATDIFFENDCFKGAIPIDESGQTADQFSTGDVLALANTIAGSITYASIDNAGSTSYPNLTLVAINGVQPSQLAAANGTYGDWFEATAVTGPNLSKLSADQQALISTLTSNFQLAPTAPGGADILLDPSEGSLAAIPASSTAVTSSGATVYVNPFTRGGVSCSIPTPGY